MSVGRVRADLRQAQALDAGSGDLPRVGAALAAGALTPEHATVAVAALSAIPCAVRAERGADIDTRLTKDALDFAPPVTRVLARHLLAAVDPDRADAFDADGDRRRELFLTTDPTGMLLVRGQLGPAGGAAVKALLDHLCAPHRRAPHDSDGGGGGDGQGEGGGGEGGGGPGEGGGGGAQLGVANTRTAPQRRADALAEMARLASGNLHAGARAGEAPRVVVHTSIDQLAAARRDGAAAFLIPPATATCEQTGPIAPATLAHLACDAVLDRVVLATTGRVLQMRSLGRLFTPAQRRALAARDRGCAWPGCDRPPTWTDAYHVIHWTDGGPTTIDNGVLLCGPHHTSAHHSQWRILIRDGLPWFIPPPELGPLQRPLRNTVHDAITANTRLGHHLRRALPPSPGPPPDTS